MSLKSLHILNTFIFLFCLIGQNSTVTAQVSLGIDQSEEVPANNLMIRRNESQGTVTLGSDSLSIESEPKKKNENQDDFYTISDLKISGKNNESMTKGEEKKIILKEKDKNADVTDFGNIKNWLFSDKGFLGRDNLSSSIKTLMVMSFFSLAPAILLMTTSFVRISVVLGLLRQAIGAGQIPSNQVITALSLFLTLLIMYPVWNSVYQDSVVPYANGTMSSQDSIQIGQRPIKQVLWGQIEKSGNLETIELFTKYVPNKSEITGWENAPWRVILPAFLVSELRVAFLIGFQIFLPFLIIDIVVSCILTSIGMVMLPPVVVALPFKLILFVLVDGWTLTIKSLLESFTL